MDIRKEIDYQYDMLIGNINRICVTRDREELEDMYDFAKKRLDDIYKYSVERLEEIEKSSGAFGGR